MELSIRKAGMRNREQHVQGSWYLERGRDREGAGELGSSYDTYGCVGHAGAAGLTLKHWGMIFRSVFRKISLLFLFFWWQYIAFRILVPRPGIPPGSLAVKV